MAARTPSGNRRRSVAQAGFTLTEIVIAVAILGLIGTLVAGTFGRALEGREQAEIISARYHQFRQAMLRMSREIQMAYVSEHRDCDDPHTKTVFKASSSSHGARLDFASFSHYKMRADANESDQNELAYWIDQHPDPDPEMPQGTLALLRRESARIDEEPEEGGVVQVMAENVKSIRFEFYDEKEDRWEEEWDTEDSDHADRLPMYVAIHLKAVAPDGTDEDFVTKTRVFLRRPIYLRGGKCVE